MVVQRDHISFEEDDVLENLRVAGLRTSQTTRQVGIAEGLYVVYSVVLRSLPACMLNLPPQDSVGYSGMKNPKSGLVV